MDNLLQHLNRDLAAVGAAVTPGLVQVRSGRRGAGAGVVWAEDGLIMTNAHVVRGARALTVHLHDGRTAPARLVAVDRAADLALIHTALPGLDAIPRGDARTLRPGNLVLALGHPWGVREAATAGVVIQVGNQLGDLWRTDRAWIAASLHLRPGHSGGPMVDADGRLVGINTLMNGPEVGVAIPVHAAEAFARQHTTKSVRRPVAEPVHL